MQRSPSRPREIFLYGKFIITYNVRNQIVQKKFEKYDIMYNRRQKLEAAAIQKIKYEDN
jgi:hypothetical protein